MKHWPTRLPWKFTVKKPRKDSFSFRNINTRSELGNLWFIFLEKMNKFETELANWVNVIKTYVSESSQISQKLRKILRKNTNADTEEFVRVFGMF